MCVLDDDETVTQRVTQTGLDEVVKLGLGDVDVAGDVPRQLDHGDERLTQLQLVVLVAFGRQRELSRGQRAYVPRDVVTPALSLIHRRLNKKHTTVSRSPKITDTFT